MGFLHPPVLPSMSGAKPTEPPTGNMTPPTGSAAPPPSTGVVAEEEDPFYTMLDRSGCVKYHYKLQDCFHDNGGDWRKCQLEMKEFRECMNKQKQSV